MRNLEDILPLENSGADTTSRFSEQLLIAMIYYLQKIIDDNFLSIRVDRFDDFVLSYQGNYAELFQVKTRNSGQKVFSIAEITKNDGDKDSILDKMLLRYNYLTDKGIDVKSISLITDLDFDEDLVHINKYNTNKFSSLNEKDSITKEFPDLKQKLIKKCRSPISDVCFSKLHFIGFRGTLDSFYHQVISHVWKFIANKYSNTNFKAYMIENLIEKLYITFKDAQDSDSDSKSLIHKDLLDELIVKVLERDLRKSKLSTIYQYLGKKMNNAEIFNIDDFNNAINNIIRKTSIYDDFGSRDSIRTELKEIDIQIFLSLSELKSNYIGHISPKELHLKYLNEINLIINKLCQNYIISKELALDYGMGKFYELTDQCFLKWII